MFKLILKYFSPIFLKIYDEYNKNEHSIGLETKQEVFVNR